MRIVLCYQTKPHHVQQIQQAMPKADVVDAGQEGVGQELPTADIFCGHAKVPVPWEEVAGAGRLKWIQSSAAGLDHCLVPSIVESDVIVSGASGLFADQVAEQTLALLLGVVRGIPTFFPAQQRREFIRRPTRDLHHQTVGIVGFGGNGRRIAEVLAPMKTRILATDMFPDDCPEHVEALWGVDRLPELLQQSDIVILCVPLTELTRGMFQKETLGQMKSGAILINVARGSVVVESDLVASLESGHLFGAGLDVTEVEPLSTESRLWDLPNVLITPHVGAQSFRRIDDATDRFCENLRRFQAGEPLINQIDKQLGYAKWSDISP